MLVSLSIVAATSLALAAPATTPHTAAALSFAAPSDAEVTTRALEGGPEIIAVTRGEEVLLVTVYTGKQRPSAAAALEAHGEELERRLMEQALPDSLQVKPVRVRLLKRWRQGRAVDYKRKFGDLAKRYVAQVATAAQRGKTVVVSWMAPRAGVVNAFSPAVIKSLAPIKR